MKMALAIYERRQLLSSQARRMVEEQAVEIVQYTVQFPSGLVITAKTKEALEQKIFTYLNRKTPHVD
jgi:hypothetical protein